ncbi:CRP/FNR family transcriptional regulator, anaerobic regulatory protein [Devosia enhydra]|uniref:CRP/FNR family transcriptional regulator, anaerobic regulatory protein n=1 Tax=Devosia enhydra TaxID=665118 RepID=A0A1K2HWK5_9HYPH|nr:Crp/Fnr family transcriptional regulator [Devosia enhydra]SFZ83056.1 CRP/FNR family transcriptional regulator, anaerobic regulatory protein [Devosia enhydra]
MQPERRDIHNSTTPALCMSCEARHNGMCGVLDAKQLLLMSRHTRIETHAAGTELIGDSTPITSYANVMRGVIKLTKILEDGRQQVVGLQFAPDFLGRLFGEEHRVNAEAASEVTICRVPKTALEQLVADSPALEHRLMQQALRELDDARDWMLTLGRKTAAEKVASFLYLIATHIDPAAFARRPDSASFDLPLGRADIGDFLGLTIETVSRQLTKLRTDKVITIVNTRHVDIPDLARLKGRCG